MSTLLSLDPRLLAPNHRNPRSDLGDIDDLVASIQTVGVLQPLLVIPIHGQEPAAGHDTAEPLDLGPDTREVIPSHRIVIGHRRHAAALRLQLPAVPCVVAADEGEAAELVRMISENTIRTALTVTDEAAAYHQLELLDWDVDQIAAAVAKPVTRVRDALALHRLPNAAREVAARAADAGNFDLEQVVALEAFADEPRTLARILDRGRDGGWGLRHAIAEERAKRDRRDAVERLRAELTLAGVRIVPRPRDWGYRAREAEASTLLDRDGHRLDPQQVRTRPGFAAFIDTQNLTGEARAVVICVDPENWGYTRTQRTSFVPDAEQARAQAEADRVAQLRAALTTAAGVRAAFVVEQYGSARAAKKVFPDALRAVFLTPAMLRGPDRFEELATRLAGTSFDRTVATGAGIDRLTRMLVGQWIAANEYNLDALTRDVRWNTDPAGAVAYLDRLAEAGYLLSEAEEQFRGQLVDELADTDTDETDDQGQQDDEHEDDEHGETGSDTDVSDQDDHQQARPEIEAADAQAAKAVHLISVA